MSTGNNANYDTAWLSAILELAQLGLFDRDFDSATCDREAVNRALPQRAASGSELERRRYALVAWIDERFGWSGFERSEFHSAEASNRFYKLGLPRAVIRGDGWATFFQGADVNDDLRREYFLWSALGFRGAFRTEGNLPVQHDLPNTLGEWRKLVFPDELRRRLFAPDNNNFPRPSPGSAAQELASDGRDLVAPLLWMITLILSCAVLGWTLSLRGS